MKRNRPGRPRHPDVLTPAEWRVLEALRDGSTNAEVATRLGISRDTVKYHVSNMLAKLGLDDRRALAAWRPEGRRGRLGAVLAVPAVLWAVVGRPLVWVGLGTAAIAGVAVAVVAAVGVVIAVLVLASGDSDASLVAAPPVAGTAQGTPGPTSALPPSPAPGLCTTPTDPTCIVAVYLGAPADYAQVSQIPAGVLLTPGSDGRYVVERGQQVTVVTAAPLPAEWTRFYLQRTPPGAPSPVSAEQLIQPVGTTYTFTVATDEAASTLITFDLKQARPFVRPRPDNKPHIGATVVRTVFSVEATTFRYNRLDTTGAVATPGSYAFLSDPDDTTTAVTTYEALRDGTTTGLLIHKSDAHGASQAALYDAVEAGDLFEWHTAEDCFVRYKVTEVKADPAGAVPRKLLAVGRYAFAYGSCTGSISTLTQHTAIWSPEPIRAPDMSVPVRYGTFILSPPSWTGVIEKPADAPSGGCVAGGFSAPSENADEHSLWREPDLPDGWTMDYSETGIDGIDGWASAYVDADGYRVLAISASPCHIEPLHVRGTQRPSGNNGQGGWINEARVIAGHPAIVWYDPNRRGFETRVYVYDDVNMVSYMLVGSNPLLGNDVEALVGIATSLLDAE